MKITGVKTWAPVSYSVGTSTRNTKASLGFKVGMDAIFTLYVESIQYSLYANAWAEIYYGVGTINRYTGCVTYKTPSIGVTRTGTRVTTTLTTSASSTLSCNSFQYGKSPVSSLPADTMAITAAYGGFSWYSQKYHGVACWVKNLWLDTTQSIST